MNRSSMLATEADLIKLLTEQAIEFKIYRHPAVFTADEAKIHCAHIEGAHVKNLFLRNKNKTIYFLITVQDDKKVDLLALGKCLHTTRLSFANPDDLLSLLGVTPGSVTPLAILNDHANKVWAVFDADLAQTTYINIHPLINTATIHMKQADLIQLIEKYDHPIQFTQLPVLSG